MNRREALKTVMMAGAAGLAADDSGRTDRLAASGTASVRKDLNKPPKQKMVMIGAGSAMFIQGFIID